MNSHPPGRRRYARAIRTLLLSVATIVAVSQLPTTRAQNFFTVGHLSDGADTLPGDGICQDSGGLCTLRAAIQEANATPGKDFILFNNALTGTIDLTGPLPAINSDIDIFGPGRDLLTIRRNTGGDYRILTINNGNVAIWSVTIANGKTADGASGTTTAGSGGSGGGILHTNGSLELVDVNITGNKTGNGGNTTESNSFAGDGGFGGGIASFGTLTMRNCNVVNNATGKGGDGASGRLGGFGGGIYVSGPATLTNVTVDGNSTGDGGTGINAGLSGGNSGFGGGIYIANTATLTNLTVTNNTTGNVVRGNAGDGGGLYFFSGTATLTNGIISNNHTGNGSGFLAYSGFGGGIANNATLTISNSLISGNTTGSNGPSGQGGGGAGIRNTFLLKLVNSTVSGNTVGSTDSPGVTNAGGGISNWTTMTITNCTITGNTASNNINGVAGNFSDSHTTTISNTIIAQNGSAGSVEVDGPFASLGHNLIGNGEGATGFVASDLVGTMATPSNALLGPLTADGLTKVHPLLAGSPALDAGDNALAKDANNNPLTTDQRGAARIADSPDADTTATVDIGAWEFRSTLEDITDKTTLEDTGLTFSFGLGDAGPGVTSVTATSSNQAVLNDDSITLSGSGGARTMEVMPNGEQSGTTTITVTVNLSGGGTATDTFVLTVLPVNDVPFFHLLITSDVVFEDSGTRTLPNATALMFAGLSENDQVLSFHVTNNTNPSLFAVAPAISQAGTLTYTPAANVFGSADITVVLKDDGGTANGGRDTSDPATFKIQVTPVNDAPTFTKGADQTVSEDAGFVSIGNWAMGVSTGPANESNQSLTSVVTNNTNPSLFQTQPFISFFGNRSLNFAPAANATGTAEITLVIKDDGGTADGGVNTSPPQTFTITVTPVNDTPFNNLPFSPQTNQQTPIIFSAANFNAISVGDVDAGTDPIRVSLTATQGTISLGSTTGLAFTAGDGTDDASMTFTAPIATINSGLNGLTFKPAGGFSGTANLQIVTNDDGHNGDGGAKIATSNLNILVRSGGRFSFNTANYGVNESGGTTTITVLRAGGSAGTATVNYSTSNGTATSGSSCTAGVDFIGTTGSFTWNNGDTSVRTFTITICNDRFDEADETINLTLSNVGGTGSLGTQPAATLTIGNDDGPPVLFTEENTQHALALDLVTQTSDPFSLTSLFNLGNDQRRRVSLFVMHLELLPGDPISVVGVVGRDDEGRSYDLPVESVSSLLGVSDATQIIVRLPDNVIGAPRNLWLKVTVRERSSNEAFIKIAAP
jgi:Calx-beta domain/Bacterial Ig domain